MADQAVAANDTLSFPPSRIALGQS